MEQKISLDNISLKNIVIIEESRVTHLLTLIDNKKDNVSVDVYKNYEHIQLPERKIEDKITKFFNLKKDLKILMIDTSWLYGVYRAKINLREAIIRLNKELKKNCTDAEIIITSSVYEEFSNLIPKKDKGVVLNILYNLKTEGIITLEFPPYPQSSEYHPWLDRIKELQEHYSEKVGEITLNLRIGKGDAEIMKNIEELQESYKDYDVAFLILTTDYDFVNLTHALGMNEEVYVGGRLF